MYGISIEFAQSFVPHRTDFLITDVLMNTVGASCVLAWYAIRPALDLKSILTLLSEVYD